MFFESSVIRKLQQVPLFLQFSTAVEEAAKALLECVLVSVIWDNVIGHGDDTGELYLVGVAAAFALLNGLEVGQGSDGAVVCGALARFQAFEAEFKGGVDSEEDEAAVIPERVDFCGVSEAGDDVVLVMQFLDGTLGEDGGPVLFAERVPFVDEVVSRGLSAFREEFFPEDV